MTGEGFTMDDYDTLAENDISNLLPAEWFKRFVYVAEGDYFFEVVTRQEYTRYSFNAIYRGYPCYSIHNK